MQVTTAGLDLTKTILHVHGVTEVGEVAFNRPLRRSQVQSFFDRIAPCIVKSSHLMMPGLIEAYAHVVEGRICRFNYCGHYPRIDPSGTEWPSVRD